MALMVSIYTGGDVLTGPNGVYYSIGPVTVIPVLPGTDYLGLKSSICQNLGLDQGQYDLKIDAKISMPTSSAQTWFQLFPIQNEGVWQVLYNQTMSFSGGAYKIIDLYVEVTRARRSNPVQRLIQGRSRGNSSGSSPSPVQIDQPSSSRAPVQRDRPSRRAPSQTDQPSSSRTAHWGQTCNPDESDEEVDPEILEAEENWGHIDPEGMSDYSDQEDTGPVLGLSRKFKMDSGFQIMDRGFQHPIHAFNDTSGFMEANSGLFGSRAEYENELSEGQTYDSKEAMKSAIARFHILCNKEVKPTHSDRTRMRFKCKDSYCGWYILARATGYGTQWRVSKCPTQHSCHADATRTDHAQLSAAMVAECISAHMRNDVDLSIQAVRIAVAERYNGQIPAYNKLWRGRELAIARQFGSWEGSYALVVPLLEAIKRSNPGTTLFLQFLRHFIINQKLNLFF